ncbi:hypothetical protein FSP39_019784 [Pinctada imbricata]|uniref:Uncharacterized protein n=1 Tax=Pinctada imbricata TaxID=66713 RepID=A0AA88XDH9_PINIB|nr:hypothetical protein FSP39_019784 [Pinctada imbricata]
MDVYSRLSDLQALHLAYSHNDMHENSRQMSFAEKVELFHNIRDRIVKSYKDTLGERQIATKWREEVANITSKTKAEVKNCYRTHLFLASFSGELWDALSGVLKPSKTKHISKNEKVKELTQYHFVNFSKVETTEERIKLLQQLSNKEITVEEFRDICVGLRYDHAFLVLNMTFI